MKKTLLFLVFIVAGSAQAKDWRIDSGTLQYTLKHMLHTVEGTSREVKGLGKCSATCTFLVAAPVKSFDSKNSNRDSNMQKFTKAALYPMVEVRTTVLPAVGKKTCDLVIKFAGKTHSYSVPVEFIKEGNGFKVHAMIPVNLSDFEVERPSLFGVNVEDKVPVTVDLHITAS